MRAFLPARATSFAAASRSASVTWRVAPEAVTTSRSVDIMHLSSARRPFSRPRPASCSYQRGTLLRSYCSHASSDVRALRTRMPASGVQGRLGQELATGGGEEAASNSAQEHLELEEQEELGRVRATEQVSIDRSPAANP